MRSRIMFTVFTLGVAGVLGAAAGAVLHNYGHAFVVTAVVVLGVLTIGLLEWDHSLSGASKRTVTGGEPESSAGTQHAMERKDARSAQSLV